MESERRKAVPHQPRPLSQTVWQTLLLVLLSAIIVPLVILAFLLFALHRAVLYLLIWILWLPRGKDTLFVSSDSPIWCKYMTQQVLPLVQERAVVLNWSERSIWRRWSLPVCVLRSFGGEHAFNPLVVVFRPPRRAKLFRFWWAFKDFKHGRTEPVERLRNDLRMSL
jgi:hypothetical protein